MESKVASILIKQYTDNSTKTFTYEKHSTVYIYCEKSFQYIGMTRIWIETSRTTQGTRRMNKALHGVKRVRPIGEKTIEECFRSINLTGLNVEIHNDEIYIDSKMIRQFVIRCFQSFFTETYNYDKKKYGNALRRSNKCSYRGIY